MIKNYPLLGSDHGGHGGRVAALEWRWLGGTKERGAWPRGSTSDPTGGASGAIGGGPRGEESEE